MSFSGLPQSVRHRDYAIVSELVCVFWFLISWYWVSIHHPEMSFSLQARPQHVSFKTQKFLGSLWIKIWRFFGITKLMVWPHPWPHSWALFPLLMSKVISWLGKRAKEWSQGSHQRGQQSSAKNSCPVACGAEFRSAGCPFLLPPSHWLSTLGRPGQLPPVDWLSSQISVAAWPRTISSKLERGCLVVVCQTRVPQKGGEGRVEFLWPNKTSSFWEKSV